MLILEQYGVRLLRLQESDIELVRTWRNRPDISGHMEYRENITAEAQKEWFKGINNKHNYYFIIEFENKKVGLINAKNLNPALGFGEGGIFIGDPDYINSFAAVFSSLCLLNFVFCKLQSCASSRIRILKDNERAIHYNKLLGYKLLPEQENVLNQLYELTKEEYLEQGSKLNKAAAILSGINEDVRYSGNPSNENTEEINLLLQNN